MASNSWYYKKKKKRFFVCYVNNTALEGLTLVSRVNSSMCVCCCLLLAIFTAEKHCPCLLLHFCCCSILWLKEFGSLFQLTLKSSSEMIISILLFGNLRNTKEKALSNTLCLMTDRDRPQTWAWSIWFLYLGNVLSIADGSNTLFSIGFWSSSTVPYKESFLGFSRSLSSNQFFLRDYG